MFHRDASAMSYNVLQMHSSTADNVIYWKLCVWLPKTFVWCMMESFGNVGKTLPQLFIFIIYIYNNSSFTSSSEPLYNLRWIPHDIWLSNRRTSLFVADEYRRERIYFRYWEHRLFHWCSCKYLLHICLLFCLILSCKRYKHMHIYFMTLQIYSICNNYPTPPSWTYRIIKNCE